MQIASLSFFDAQTMAYKKCLNIVSSVGNGAQPIPCYLAIRGLKTLYIRSREHQKLTKEITDQISNVAQSDPGLSSTIVISEPLQKFTNVNK